MARSRDKFFKLLADKGIDRNDPSVSEFINDFDGDFAEATKAIQEREKLVDANQRWSQWYSQRGHMVDSLEQEKQEMAAQLDRLRQAGVRLSGEEAEVADSIQRGAYVTPDQLASLKQEIFGTFSAVTKDLLTIQGEHYKQFGETPDLEAIEKIVSEKNIPVRAAYQEWSAPKRETRAKEETEKEIKRRVEEMLRDERSKMGVAGPRPKKPSDAVSPLVDVIQGKKTEPSNKSTMDKLNSFVNDMYSTEPN